MHGVYVHASGCVCVCACARALTRSCEFARVRTLGSRAIRRRVCVTTVSLAVDVEQIAPSPAPYDTGAQPIPGTKYTPPHRTDTPSDPIRNATIAGRKIAFPPAPIPITNTNRWKFAVTIKSVVFIRSPQMELLRAGIVAPRGNCNRTNCKYIVGLVCSMI